MKHRSRRRYPCWKPPWRSSKLRSVQTRSPSLLSSRGVIIRIHAAVVIACAILGVCARADEKADFAHRLIPWLLDESASTRGILFSDVIAATSGKRVLPINAADSDTQRVLQGIGGALDAVLARMNGPESPVRGVKRVNEMSSHFEDALRTRLAAVPGFGCDIPRTAAGGRQRAGYPDLRLTDRTSGRVCYVDPKLYAKGSRGSSFRTFYFQPKRETNKVTDDAHHLIAAIEHERGADGAIRFVRWQLIDLSRLRVHLKAEFEASNADMYRPEVTVAEGTSE